MKIGLRLASLQLPLRKAVQVAGRTGAAGVQVDAYGELMPDQISQTGRREFRHLLRSHNLEVTAVGCPMRRGLNVLENIELRLEHVRKVMTLAVDLGPRVVVVEAGRIGVDPVADGVLREALLVLSRFGDTTGATLALETGNESGEAVAKFLDQFDTGALAVNFDPANLLIHGFNPYQAIAALQKRIAHVHCKDARQAAASAQTAELLLGHGDIEWMRLLDLLREADYRGWLTVERENGPLTADQATAGVAFLKRFA